MRKSLCLLLVLLIATAPSVTTMAAVNSKAFGVKFTTTTGGDFIKGVSKATAKFKLRHTSTGVYNGKGYTISNLYFRKIGDTGLRSERL